MKRFNDAERETIYVVHTILPILECPLDEIIHESSSQDILHETHFDEFRKIRLSPFFSWALFDESLNGTNFRVVPNLKTVWLYFTVDFLQIAPFLLFLGVISMACQDRELLYRKIVVLFLNARILSLQDVDFWSMFFLCIMYTSQM